jgi:predicted O-methyltransferase YrrM
MFRKFKDRINNFIVLVTRKADSSRKNFYELEKISYKDSAQFMYNNMKSAVLFTNLEKFWSYSLSQIVKEGMLMEFGVFIGYSINYFSNELKNKNDKRIVYGFDSFEGLSETWGGTNLAKGHFDVKGSMPKVNENVNLVKGWIDDTLPKFSAEKDFTKNKVAFIHVDVDTYTPTKTILENTQKHFVPGTIIVFDELFGYPGWREHEFKALEEVVNPNWNYEYIAYCEIQRKDYTSEYIRTAIRITGKK